MIVFNAKSINCDIVPDCFPLRTVAFRGHGFSLLALAKGMSTLFAKNGFSRPSLNYCGVFRHVLGLRTARPIENLCSRRSHRPPLTPTGTAIYGKTLLLANAIPATRIHEDSCGRKGIGGTTQCVSTRRPTSRPRKA